MRQVVALLVTGGLVVGGLIGGGVIDYSDTGEGRAATTTTSGAGGSRGTLASFCDATQRLNQAQRSFLSGFQQRENASPEDFALAQRQFAKRSKPLLREVQRTAPEAIRSDVATAVAAAGAPPRPSDRGTGLAVRRVIKFTQQNC